MLQRTISLLQENIEISSCRKMEFLLHNIMSFCSGGTTYLARYDWGQGTSCVWVLYNQNVVNDTKSVACEVRACSEVICIHVNLKLGPQFQLIAQMPLFLHF
ncbi:hypothetical protein GOP47_0028748 [Adiantum capillus-veneris]|nr:hypothetical protein GOP47_0028748 [Adiantum capillus-veneris]